LGVDTLARLHLEIAQDENGFDEAPILQQLGQLALTWIGLRRLIRREAVT
jgi:hypothetical protein